MLNANGLNIFFKSVNDLESKLNGINIQFLQTQKDALNTKFSKYLNKIHDQLIDELYKMYNEFISNGIGPQQYLIQLKKRINTLVFDEISNNHRKYGK